MEAFKKELINAILEVVQMLADTANPDDRQLCVTRLEVLAENNLHYDGIPRKSVDGIQVKLCIYLKAV